MVYSKATAVVELRLYFTFSIFSSVTCNILFSNPEFQALSLPWSQEVFTDLSGSWWWLDCRPAEFTMPVNGSQKRLFHNIWSGISGHWTTVMAGGISVPSLRLIVFGAGVFGADSRRARCDCSAPLCRKPVLTLDAPAPSGNLISWVSFLCQNGSHSFQVEI